ncbi:alanine racemase [Phenylobacterium sp.]|uniref:alanine racemase n=1 Tax=Phenylobacterium sp. TaxID=1871053 RepID=UPI00301DD4BA
MTIDLAAVGANYRTIRAHAAPARVAAVVKADAYGLGVGPVAKALVRAGCRDFFVADLTEASDLRGRLGGDCDIYVLNGLWAGSEAAAAAAGLTPVLNSLAQLDRWAGLGRAVGRALPAVLQLDTGMSRLGLEPVDVAALVRSPGRLDGLDMRYLMSHMACADVGDDAVNARQRAQFESLAAQLPPWPRSLANSAAALTDQLARGDLVRSGLAIYGAVPGPGLRPVVGLSARVIQVRTVTPGTGVGYGLTYQARRTEHIATVGVGYADGWPRALSNRGAAYLGEVRLPIVGQVSMDSMMIDATELGDRLQAGDAVELIGPNQTLAQAAALADTIPYELLTRLGRRYARSYRQDADAAIVGACA